MLSMLRDFMEKLSAKAVVDNIRQIKNEKKIRPQLKFIILPSTTNLYYNNDNLKKDFRTSFLFFEKIMQEDKYEYTTLQKKTLV